MQWYYEKNGEKGGPVAEYRLRELLERGEIGLETLVWKEGMPDWAPLSQAAPFLSAALPEPAPELPPPVPPWENPVPAAPAVAAAPAPAQAQAPQVVFWFRIFCGAMALLYVFVAMAGGLLLAMGDQIAADGGMEPMEVKIQGIVCLVMGPIFFIPYLIGIFLPARSWSWVVGLILIALSLTSCFCLPAAVPLLIFWIKPEAKAWFEQFKVAKA